MNGPWGSRATGFRPMSRALLTASVMAVLMLMQAPAPAGAAVPGRAHGAGRFVPHELLVRARPGGFAASATARLDARFGAVTLEAFGLVPGLRLVGLAADVGVEAAAAAYAHDPHVLYAQPNWVSRVLSVRHASRPAPLNKTPNDPRFGEQWGLDAMHATTAWDTTIGRRSVVVGDIDTGMDYTHQDLEANAWRNVAECNGTPGVDDDGNGYVDDCHGIDTINGDSDPMDDNSHGTLTAGVIGAVGNNGVGIAGLNWRMQVLPCKSHDQNGNGSVASIIECYQYMVTEKAAGYDIVATNNSYADCPEACGYDQATRDGIAAMGKAGILFAVAAGNNGRDLDQQPIYPANYFLPNVIPAAATTAEQNLASFSNYGDRVVMVGAPGEDVLSTAPGNAYDLVSGTSLASPHVAGLAALIHAAHPKMDIYRIRNLIVSGGHDLGDLAGTTLSGMEVDAAGSLNCAGSNAFGLLQPLDQAQLGKLTVAAMSIQCGKPFGPKIFDVTVTPGDVVLHLKDGGRGADLRRGDGISSASWTPAATGTYTLTFAWNQASYTVVVSA